MKERATDPLAGWSARRRASRRALAHPIATIRALVCEHASPRNLAAAAAVGTLVGALPLTGYHTVLVLLLAGRLRLNRLLALATNQIGIPPFVPFACIEVGHLVRHGRFLTEVSIHTIWDQAGERLIEWAIGSLTLGPLLAAVVGGVVWALAAFAARRGGAGVDDTVSGDRSGELRAGCRPGAGKVEEKATAAPVGQP